MQNVTVQGALRTLASIALLGTLACGNWTRAGTQEEPAPSQTLTSVLDETAVFQRIGRLAVNGPVPFVGSVAFLPGPGMAVYHASKAYVLSLSEALHEELKEGGVRVCALCPGPSPATGFFSRAGLPADYFPAVLMRDAVSIARAGYDGFMGGHRVVVPGKPSRIVTLLPRLLPRAVVRAVGGWRWRRQRRATM